MICKTFRKSVFTCHNLRGIKYLTRIRLGFSHLRYRKFKHGFLDAIDPFCSCSTGIENTVHYFLHCPNFPGKIVMVNAKMSRWNSLSYFFLFIIITLLLYYPLIFLFSSRIFILVICSSSFC